MGQLEEEDCPLEVMVAGIEALGAVAATGATGAEVVVSREMKLHQVLVQTALGASSRVSSKLNQGRFLVSFKMAWHWLIGAKFARWGLSNGLKVPN